jgi:hypothetical protein
MRLDVEDLVAGMTLLIWIGGGAVPNFEIPLVLDEICTYLNSGDEIALFQSFFVYTDPFYLPLLLLSDCTGHRPWCHLALLSLPLALRLEFGSDRSIA